MRQVPTNADNQSVRPGLGATQFQVTTTDGTLSAFQTVRTLVQTTVEPLRVNLVWVPGSDNVYSIQFGPDATTVNAGLFTNAPRFTVSHGIIRFLMTPADTGFRIQAFAAPTGGAIVTNNLYGWVG